MPSITSTATRASLAAIITFPFHSTPAGAVGPLDLVLAATRLPCQTAPVTDLASLSEGLPSARPRTSWVRFSHMAGIGRRTVFELAGDQLVVQFSGPSGRPRQIAVRYTVGERRRPTLLAIADASCTIQLARLLTYDAAGRPDALADLDSALHPAGEPQPLNPAVPPGTDPPGIPVAVVDTGVNYLLPEIGQRLARDAEGRMLGYDYWDLDRRPFDAEPTADPFHPLHHGTLVASLLLDEAPAAKLVPYRYPRGDMGRMTALIEDAASHGVRVMNLSLAGRTQHEWLPFRAAARAHPAMLFVVAAGNWGRDLARQPAYPAALGLDNAIVVTSASALGELTTGVNFGARIVDLMARGEEVVALDFDGVRRPVSGSSYATARVSALAACLLAEHPEWSTAELKAAIFGEAERRGSGQVAHGFLADEVLGNRGACRRPTVIAEEH